MARKLQFDKLLFLATFLLVGSSIVMVYSASAVVAMERFQQPYLFLIKQVMWIALGIALLAVIMRIDYRSYRNPWFLWSALGGVTVALGLVLFTSPINGSSRWFTLGGVGLQPAEFAKLGTIFCVAGLLARPGVRAAERPRAVLPVLLVVALFAGLILLEPDLGTATIVVAIAAAMVFAAGVDFRYVAGAAVASLPVFYLALSSEYARRRLLGFLDPWGDPLGDGFQAIQAFIAVGTGGIFGRGVMDGVQKLFYLPEPHTDFIYAVIGEELGLIGATVILVCFCIIIGRGLLVSARATDPFGAYLAVGLTAMIGVQAFMNMSVVLGLLPTTGIPLPFVSAGGSSLLVNMMGMGALLNISQHVASPGETRVDSPDGTRVTSPDGTRVVAAPRRRRVVATAREMRAGVHQ